MPTQPREVYMRPNGTSEIWKYILLLAFGSIVIDLLVTVAGYGLTMYSCGTTTTCNYNTLIATVGFQIFWLIAIMVGWKVTTKPQAIPLSNRPPETQ